MLNLEGLFNAETLYSINTYTEFRLKNKQSLVTPESLAIYEQNYLEPSKLKELCETAYGHELYEPIRSYVPDSIIDSFKNSNLIPVTYMPMQSKVIAVYIPELTYTEVTITNFVVETLPTTLHYYLNAYQEYYGIHPIVQEIAAKTYFEMVVNEGISLEAADITISSCGKKALVYYNVRKRKVDSKRIIPSEVIPDIITYLTIRSPHNFSSRKPKYIGVDLNKDYRGRIVINTKWKGYAITTRLLPNAAFTKTLEDLNLSPNTIEFLRDDFSMREAGLHLIVGATMSGKNTTILAGLKEIADLGRYKIVSVEMPVEQELPGIEQNNTETIDEYEESVASLVRQNPDIVYITEIMDETANATLRAANTGKCVYSSLHGNSVADAIPRLMDITGLSIDRIIQIFSSITYQELRRDEETDTVRPFNRYIRFTQDLKEELYDKSLGEVIKIINSREEGDV